MRMYGAHPSVIDWTEENVETLKKLLLDGLSASEVAREMRIASRSAIIGKASRLGIKFARVGTTKLGRAPDEKHARRLEQWRQYTAKRSGKSITATTERKVYTRCAPVEAIVHIIAKPIPVLPIEAPASLGLPLIELRRFQCHWATDRDTENDQWLFCGAPTDDHSYCAFHRSIGTVTTALRPVRESSQGSHLLGIRMLDPEFASPALSAEA